MSPNIKTQRAMLAQSMTPRDQMCACNNGPTQCEDCRNEYDRAQLLRVAAKRLNALDSSCWCAP